MAKQLTIEQELSRVTSDNLAFSVATCCSYIRPPNLWPLDLVLVVHNHDLSSGGKGFSKGTNHEGFSMTGKATQVYKTICSNASLLFHKELY